MDADANVDDADAEGSTIAFHERCSGELKINNKCENAKINSETLFAKTISAKTRIFQSCY